MSSFIALPIALIVGVTSGVLYFGGLWLTVQHLPRVTYPELLAIVSFAGRAGIAALGFWTVLQLSPHLEILNLGICLVMFFGVRNRLIKRLQPFQPQRLRTGKHSITQNNYRRESRHGNQP